MGIQMRVKIYAYSVENLSRTKWEQAEVEKRPKTALIYAEWSVHDHNKTKQEVARSNTVKWPWTSVNGRGEMGTLEIGRGND